MTTPTPYGALRERLERLLEPSSLMPTSIHGPSRTERLEFAERVVAGLRAILADVPAPPAAEAGAAAAGADVERVRERLTRIGADCPGGVSHIMHVLREEGVFGPGRHGMSADRVETGPVQFGDDWPGVFIRGDNALHFAMKLGLYLGPGGERDFVVRADVERLLATLASCESGKCSPRRLPAAASEPPPDGLSKERILRNEELARKGKYVPLAAEVAGLRRAAAIAMQWTPEEAGVLGNFATWQHAVGLLVERLQREANAAASEPPAAQVTQDDVQRVTADLGSEEGYYSHDDVYEILRRLGVYEKPTS